MGRTYRVGRLDFFVWLFRFLVFGGSFDGAAISYSLSTFIHDALYGELVRFQLEYRKLLFSRTKGDIHFSGSAAVRRIVGTLRRHYIPKTKDPVITAIIYNRIPKSPNPLNLIHQVPVDYLSKHTFHPGPSDRELIPYTPAFPRSTSNRSTFSESVSNDVLSVSTLTSHSLVIVIKLS